MLLCPNLENVAIKSSQKCRKLISVESKVGKEWRMFDITINVNNGTYIQLSEGTNILKDQEFYFNQYHKWV